MSKQAASNGVEDEIDLGEVLLAIWDGKWLIIGLVVLGVVLGGFVSQVIPRKFSSNLKIHTISAVQATAYRELNDFEFFKVVPGTLRNALMEKVASRDILKSQFLEVNYLPSAGEKSVGNTPVALNALAAQVKLIAPLRDDEFAKDRKQLRRKNYWEITFDGVDRPKYLTALRHTLVLATDEVRQEMVYQFNEKLERSKRRIEQSVVDIDREIENAVQDYDKKTARRLAFLAEQAAIARRLGVQKDLYLLEQNPNVLTVIEGGVKNPFYLRGYDAIEEEIEQLRNRKDKSLFVTGLIELETKKRDLLQDPTIDRVQAAFEKTPLFSNDGFVAAQFDVDGTQFTHSNRRLMIIAVSGFLGLIAGLFILVLRNVLRSRAVAT